jgi:hypothetical protein
MAREGMSGGPDHQAYPGPAPEERRIQNCSEEDHSQQNGAHRDGMAEGDGCKSQNHKPPALAVQPECDGKQPAHGRVQAMEGAEAYKCQPGPESG